MMTDTMTMRRFVEAHRIRMTADWADANPNMPDPMPGSSHWRCVLKRGRRRMTVYFTMGPALSREPSVEDVLDCLASDSATIESAETFEQWCGEYGYDTDSRKAEHTYKTVRRQAYALERLLGPEQYEALLFNTERL